MNCANCLEPILSLRRNKKFCSSQCRVDFHNKEQRKLKAKKLLIQELLDQNYEVLNNALQLKSNWTYHELLFRGYDFSFQTHITKPFKHWSIKYLYDICIWQDKEDRILLKRRTYFKIA